MMADKLVGPKVRITLSKFLPVIFMEAMRDSPEASVQMFEGDDHLVRILFAFGGMKSYLYKIFHVS